MSRILLLGANGFIGSKLYSGLSKKFEVIPSGSVKGAIGENFIKLDLTNLSAVNDFAVNCNHFNAIIFLVGLAHTKGKRKKLPEFEKVNYQTLVNLLSALELNYKIPEKIIFASTISVYGEKYHQSIYVEGLAQKPFSPYAVTKLQAEKYLLDKFDDKSWILRFAPVYSSGFLLNINRRTYIGSRPYRVGKGSKKLSLCNIENIRAVIEKIIINKVPTGIYNLSDPKEYTYNELLWWQKAKWVFPIPVFLVKMLYYLGKFINSTFLKENSVKLISDNVFPSKKIRSYIDLPATINDVKFGND